MTDLGMMTGKAALRLAKEESGLTRDEIAERLGVSHSVTKRYFNINDTYKPSTIEGSFPSSACTYRLY